MRKLIVDLDHTITLGNTSDYENVSPNIPVINQLRNYKNQGFEIVISTARNMRTYEANVGKINIHTLPTIVAWLDKHNVPYDEILVGKPWCGKEGFYIDDRAIRPSEFASKTSNEINELLKQELEEIKKLCS
ncbi:capsular biosynthesis protein [Enterovibrio norvegicus]|uniref:capsular biosynthesis protein n=1 Tax=Enterovibrio norvegicus TaxID=188144 RepID=UPI0010BE754B|nr:capsular biosynthesis protein [Enterovibrio norvegicus]TKF36289.1 capsular biosynthesis protein [Enterovibrio norvegicus]